MTNKASDAIKLSIMGFEKLMLIAYRDASGYLTIGFGHRIIKNLDKHLAQVTDSKQDADLIIDGDQAQTLFELDCSVIEWQINQLKMNLTQTQYDAVFSFVYNLGIGTFQHSTLYRTIEQGDIIGAGEHFLDWKYGRDNRGLPIVLEGLLKRRDAERCIFTSELTPMKLRKSMYSSSAFYEMENVLIKYSKDLLFEKQIKIDLL